VGVAVHRHVSPVAPEHLGTFAELDPTAPGRGGHMNFDMILRRCGHAWTGMLDELGCFGTATIVPRLEVDYRAEVGAGELVVDTQVLHVGRSSFRLGQSVQQDGTVVADVQVVLVSYDYATGGAVPLTDQQRAALAQHAQP
jgi:acyl-CoA thioesterase FadM